MTVSNKIWCTLVIPETQGSPSMVRFTSSVFTCLTEPGSQYRLISHWQQSGWVGDLALKSPLGSMPWYSLHVDKPAVPGNSMWWSRSYCISSGQDNALHILLWLSTRGLSYTKLHIDSNIHLLGISSDYTVFMIQKHTLGLAFMCNSLLDQQLQHPRDFRRRYLV